MAIDRIEKRLKKAVATLENAGVPYAIVGGHAVAEWVGTVDEGAARFTKDVDILLRRSHLSVVIEAMQSAGFEYHNVWDVDLFIEPDCSPSEGVHVIFAGERVKESDLQTAPDVDESTRTARGNVITLEALVTMKLTSFRDKDRMHLRDMIGVGLIDQSWTHGLPTDLAARLQQILDTPDG